MSCCRFFVLWFVLQILGPWILIWRSLCLVEWFVLSVLGPFGEVYIYLCVQLSSPALDLRFLFEGGRPTCEAVIERKVEEKRLEKNLYFDHLSATIYLECYTKFCSPVPFSRLKMKKRRRVHDFNNLTNLKSFRLAKPFYKSYFIIILLLEMERKKWYSPF